MTGKEWLMQSLQQKVNYLERQRQVISKKDLPDRKDLVALLTGVIGVGVKDWPKMNLHGNGTYENFQSRIVYNYRKHSPLLILCGRASFLKSAPQESIDECICFRYID